MFSEEILSRERIIRDLMDLHVAQKAGKDEITRPLSTGTTKYFFLLSSRLNFFIFVLFLANKRLSSSAVKQGGDAGQAVTRITLEDRVYTPFNAKELLWSGRVAEI